MSRENVGRRCFCALARLSDRNRPGICFFHNLVSGPVSCQRAWAVGFFTSPSFSGKTLQRAPARPERQALEIDGRDPVCLSSRMSWKNVVLSLFCCFGTLSVRNRPGIYFFHNLVSGPVSCQRAWAVGFLTSRHSPGKPYRDHLHSQKRS